MLCDKALIEACADEERASRYLTRLLSIGVCPSCGAKSDLGIAQSAGEIPAGTAAGEPCPIGSGTLFAGSSVPLHKWLQLMYLSEWGVRPIGTYHLERILNVCRKTAAEMARSLSAARQRCVMVRH